MQPKRPLRRSELPAAARRLAAAMTVAFPVLLCAAAPMDSPASPAPAAAAEAYKICVDGAPTAQPDFSLEQLRSALVIEGRKYGLSMAVESAPNPGQCAPEPNTLRVELGDELRQARISRAAWTTELHSPESDARARLDDLAAQIASYAHRSARGAGAGVVDTEADPIVLERAVTLSEPRGREPTEAPTRWSVTVGPRYLYEFAQEGHTAGVEGAVQVSGDRGLWRVELAGAWLPAQAIPTPTGLDSTTFEAGEITVGAAFGGCVGRFCPYAGVHTGWNLRGLAVESPVRIEASERSRHEWLNAIRVGVDIELTPSWMLQVMTRARLILASETLEWSGRSVAPRQMAGVGASMRVAYVF